MSSEIEHLDPLIDIERQVLDALNNGAREHWERTALFRPQWGGKPIFYTLYNQLGVAVPCRICKHTDRWVYLQPWDGKHHVFVCLHGAVCEILPLRVLDSIPIHDDREIREDELYTTAILRIEIAHSPDDPDYDQFWEAMLKQDEHYEIDNREGREHRSGFDRRSS